MIGVAAPRLLPGKRRDLRHGKDDVFRKCGESWLASHGGLKYTPAPARPGTRLALVLPPLPDVPTRRSRHAYHRVRHSCPGGARRHQRRAMRAAYARGGAPPSESWKRSAIHVSGGAGIGAVCQRDLPAALHFAFLSRNRRMTAPISAPWVSSARWPVS